MGVGEKTVRSGWTVAAAIGLLASLTVALAGCGRPPAAPPGLSLIPTSFTALPGWEQDRMTEALPALLRSCAAIAKLPGDKSIGPNGLAGTPADWREACSMAALVPKSDDAAMVKFMADYFRPFAALDRSGKPGLFTGYYEADLEGSLVPTSDFQAPLYRLPHAPVTMTRAEIDAGGLAGQGLELLWLHDAVDAFMLQVQGSGRIRLTDGRTIRVGYAGNNGQKFVPIGKVMAEGGVIQKSGISMQVIRDWLKTHTAEAMAWMQKNPRYIFFDEVTGEGPLGAMGVPLTAGRSLAVDPDFLPLGVPVWLDTAWPVDSKTAKAGAPMQRLMVAQDVGNAIKGPVRGDVFWGSGDAALDFAGHMKNPGRYFLLLPKPVAERNTLTVTDILSQQ